MRQVDNTVGPLAQSCADAGCNMKANFAPFFQCPCDPQAFLCDDHWRGHKRTCREWGCAADACAELIANNLNRSSCRCNRAFCPTHLETHRATCDPDSEGAADRIGSDTKCLMP